MKLFKVLSGVLLSLIIIKISLDFYARNVENITLKENISKEEISKIFLSSLNSFDISEKMITKLSDLNVEHFKVNVYSDVPIELILLEFERNFTDKNVTITSKDSIQNKRTICKIFSDNKPILKCDLIVVDTLIRNKGNISFIIKTNEPDEIDKEIIESPEPISFLIVPAKSLQKTLRILKENNKKYYFLINDEIKDLIYKFGKNYSKLQTKNTLYNILEDFDHSNKIFIQNDEQWLEKSTLQLITNELKRNKISIFYTNDFVDLTEETKYPIEKINLELMKINPSETKIFTIKAKQYLELSKLFPSLRKTGYKIINISSIL